MRLDGVVWKPAGTRAVGCNRRRPDTKGDRPMASDGHIPHERLILNVLETWCLHAPNERRVTFMAQRHPDGSTTMRVGLESVVAVASGEDITDALGQAATVANLLAGRS